MKSNRLYIILKIFGFLIISIGILFICQFFTKTLEEGFQASGAPSGPSIPSQCKITRDSGRKLILCPTENDALTVFNNMSNNLPEKYDNVCITNDKFLSNYYTCYTRPGQQVFNTTYGIYRDFDPKIDEDDLAFNLVPSIETFCASYYTNTQKIIKGIASTQAVVDNLSNIRLKTSLYSSALNNMINVYCMPPKAGMESICSVINTGYQSIFSIPGSQGLNSAYNASRASLNALSNMSTQTYEMYNGSMCSRIVA
jgi:hypothetical protein